MSRWDGPSTLKKTSLGVVKKNDRGESWVLKEEEGKNDEMRVLKLRKQREYKAQGGRS